MNFYFVYQWSPDAPRYTMPLGWWSYSVICNLAAQELKSMFYFYNEAMSGKGWIHAPDVSRLMCEKKGFF